MIALLFISLLAILAGTLLHAKNKKEQLGKMFCYISWFFIGVGLLLFIGSVWGGICDMTHGKKPGQPCCPQVMMKDCTQGMPGNTCNPYGAGSCMHMDKCMQHSDCCMKHTGGIPKECCMKHDSTMKECPGHLSGDSIKMSCPKEKERQIPE